MYLRKFETVGIKGIGKKVTWNIEPQQMHRFEDNVETFGLNRSGLEFSAFKVIGLIGANASGKTSVLTSLDIGYKMLVNPMQYMLELDNIKNIFYEKEGKPVEWLFEVVAKAPKNEIKNVYKFIIELKHLNGRILYEKISYCSATRTSSSVIKTLYEVDNGTLRIDGKEYEINPMNTYFSLLKSMRARNNSLINKFAWFFISFNLNGVDNHNSTGRIFYGKLPSIPSDPKLKKLIENMVSSFDPHFKKFKIDVEGRKMIVISNPLKNDSYEEIPLRHFQSYLSMGTVDLLMESKKLTNSLISNQITIFDEIDRSVHSGLFTMQIEMLRNVKSQAIFTTHSMEVFKQNLRLDQIFEISSKNGKTSINAVIDYDGIDNREKTAKTIARRLKSKPDPKSILDTLAIMRVINKYDE